MHLKFENKSIFYQLKGTGETIVLLHGFLETSAIWTNFVHSLSIHFKTIIIDLPGFGNSSVFSQTHTMAFMAKSVKAVLDHLNITSCVMAGHSMGGYVALAFAKKHPDKLKGLCLFNSQAAADSAEAKSNRDRTIEIIEHNKLGFIRSFIPDLFAESNQKIYNSQIEELKRDASKTTKEGIIAALRGMKERSDARLMLKKFHKPVLFIAGKRDKRISSSTVLEQAGLPFHSEVLLLENVGHMGFIEAKEITLDVLKTFSHRCFNVLPE
jgi:pimeloyl-ACP methyl ester carboxylesterase